MIKRSQGVKRIVLLLSVLSVIGWISWVGVKSNGFSQIKPVGWLLLLGGVAVAYIIPKIITKVSYWVVDGFKTDKET